MDMAPFPRWADLLPELLDHVGDHLDELKSYACARATCTAWRSALAPPSPMLLVVASLSTRRCLYAASLSTRRCFEVAAIPSRSIGCLGANNGWLALSDPGWWTQIDMVLLNPVAAVEIRLPPLKCHDARWVSKVVFAPNPTKDDFAAATICGNDTVAYVTAGAGRWTVMDPIGLPSGSYLTDIVYAGEDTVYCLTTCGDVYVLRLPESRRRRTDGPANADEASPSEPDSSLLQPPPQPEPAADEHEVDFPPLRWLCQSRTFRMIHRGALTRIDQDPTTIPCFQVMRYEQAPRRTDQEPESQEPHHPNAPAATLEPLLPEANLPFSPATAFAPPYDTVSGFAGAKNLVFCEGNLYQVWRNTSCTVTLRLPAGGCRRVAENETVVLRYYPHRQPCWDVVKDLGGHSFFVGKNNAASVDANGVPGVKGNCVYWIGGCRAIQGMVFDMESGTSTPCGAPPAGFLQRRPCSPICWYLSDVMSTNNKYR